MINKLNIKGSSGFNISRKSVDVLLTPYNKDTLNYEIWLAHFVEKAKKKNLTSPGKKACSYNFYRKSSECIKNIFFSSVIEELVSCLT